MNILGTFNNTLAKHIPAKSPPILIISLPRSGSSWVGSILGRAENAMYLREPVTQSHLAAGEPFSVFEFDVEDPPQKYDAYSKMAFQGRTDFPGKIVPFSSQWHFFARQKKHIVIKEVNPLALDYFIENFAPRIIFLIRHPAAVALSYLNLGWTELRINDRFKQAVDGLAQQEKFANFWAEHGYLQGKCLSKSLEFAKKSDDLLLVKYEEVCENPLESFENIFSFSGLNWSQTIEDLVLSKSSGFVKPVKNNHYGTVRNSREQKLLWKKSISSDSLEALKTSYSNFQLPYYDADEDWQLD